MPLSFVGGATALFVRGMNVNGSTAVGFAALFGVSIMSGVLMVKAIGTRREQGASLEEAIPRGARTCLRPILMASLVAVLGLLPASVATGLGSDVQRPLATVIVWGLLGSTVLTLADPVKNRHAGLSAGPKPAGPAPARKAATSRSHPPKRFKIAMLGDATRDFRPKSRTVSQKSARNSGCGRSSSSRTRNRSSSSSRFTLTRLQPRVGTGSRGIAGSARA